MLRALPFSLLLLASSLSGQNAQRVLASSLEGQEALLDQWFIAEDASLIGHPIGTPGFGAALGGKGEQKLWRLPAASLWRLLPLRQGEAAATQPKAMIAGGLVQLRTGAQIPAEFLGGEGKNWQFRIGFGREKSEGTVPYPLFQALRLEKASKGDDAGFAKALAKPSDSQDYVFFWDKARKRLRRLSALVLGFEAGAFLVERGGRKLRIPRKRVYGIVFSRLGGIDSSAVRGVARVSVQLLDGKVLVGELFSKGKGKHLGLRVLGAIELELPLRHLRKIEWLSAQMQYVSALPSKVLRSVSPLLALAKLRKDRGLGGKLQLGDEVYERGLLLVPGLKVSFAVPESLSKGKLRLRGRIGMPRAPFGSACLRVLSGDKLQGEPLKLSANGKVRDLVIDLVDATELVLELVPGDDLDAGGRVICGELRLLRPGD